MPKPRTWLFIALGVLALLIGGTLLLVGAGVWFFGQHVKVQDAAPVAATASFDEIRARFQGQLPLIDPAASGRAVVAELERRRSAYRGPLPESLHLLVWDKDEGKVVRLTIPFWLLRFQSDQSMRVDVEGFSLQELGVSMEDVRLAGPALVLDHEERNSRILMWTE
jgi:hypothetical protein